MGLGNYILRIILMSCCVSAMLGLAYSCFFHVHPDNRDYNALGIAYLAGASACAVDIWRVVDRNRRPKGRKKRP